MAERTAHADPAMRPPQSEAERDAMVKAHYSALQIVAAHLMVAKRGLMTYCAFVPSSSSSFFSHVLTTPSPPDGVHVIHQLTQAGRTLVAVLLNCAAPQLQPLIPPGLDALRSCVGLLRRFSGRYVCGLRSGDLMEEFCRCKWIFGVCAGSWRRACSRSRGPRASFPFVSVHSTLVTSPYVHARTCLLTPLTFRLSPLTLYCQSRQSHLFNPRLHLSHLLLFDSFPFTLSHTHRLHL